MLQRLSNRSRTRVADVVTAKAVQWGKREGGEGEGEREGDERDRETETHSHSVCVCDTSREMMRPDKKQSISCGRLTERHKREEKGKNHENAVSGDTQSHRRRRRGPWKTIKSA